MSPDERYRSKKLSDQLLNELFDRLDAADAAASKRNRRKSDRLPYRKRDLQLHITHPGGGIIDCQVATRNLSSTGVSFMFWNYLHAGTVCTIHLKRHLSGIDAIEGSVVWCRHVTGPHHLVGLRFKNKIFQKLFIDPNLMDNLEGDEPVDPRSITGRILHLDDQHVERQLFKHMAGKTSVEVVSVASEAAAVEEIGKGPFDLVVIDYDLGETTADKAIPNLRTAGHAAAILCVTAETASARIAAVQAAGAGAVLQKPYNAAKLVSVLNTLLTKSYVSPSDRIFSELAGTEDMDALIDTYVKEIKVLLVQLKHEIQSNHIDVIRRLLSTIKGSAGGYGFGMLSNVATDAVKSLDATLSVAQSAFQIQQVEEIAQRICAGKPDEADK